MKPEKWYTRRIAKYVDENYGQYEDTIEWFPNPFTNQWLFDVPELNIRVEVTCYDNGTIKEQKYNI